VTSSLGAKERKKKTEKGSIRFRGRLMKLLYYINLQQNEHVEVAHLVEVSLHEVIRGIRI